MRQIRIWLYTPVLHTASSIEQNHDFAQRVVNLAKETIRYLTLLNNNSVVYRRIQVFYNHFLTSAIAVLFLASTHAPISFSAQCREEFHMALELVKDLSSRSWVSQRLWRTVKSLKAYAPRLGLQQDADPQQRENAALTMAGMASRGHNPQSMTSASTHRSSVSSAGYQHTPSPGLTPGFGGQHQHASSTRGSLTPQAGRNSPRSAGGFVHNQPQQKLQADDKNNGLRLHTEILRMYEGLANAAVRGNQVHDGPDEYFGNHMADYFIGNGSAPSVGDEDSVYPHMKGLF